MTWSLGKVSGDLTEKSDNEWRQPEGFHTDAIVKKATGGSNKVEKWGTAGTHEGNVQGKTMRSNLNSK